MLKIYTLAILLCLGSFCANAQSDEYVEKKEADVQVITTDGKMLSGKAPVFIHE